MIQYHYENYRRVQMKKKEFRPNTVTLNLRDDLPLKQDISIEFWADPSRQVIFDLFEIFGLASDELDDIPEADKEKMNARYFECASLILVDCDIKGIDFSTPETTTAAFDDERLPWGLFHQALLLYVSSLIEDYEVLKNALRRVKELSNSGTEKKAEQEKD